MQRTRAGFSTKEGVLGLRTIADKTEAAYNALRKRPSSCALKSDTATEGIRTRVISICKVPSMRWISCCRDWMWVRWSLTISLEVCSTNGSMRHGQGSGRGREGYLRAIGKRETVRVGFMGRCAFLLLPLCTFNTHIFFLDPSSRTTSLVTLPFNKHFDDPQNEEYGSVAKTSSTNWGRKKTRIKVRVLVAMVYRVEVRSAKFTHVARGAQTRKEYRREYRDTAERGVAENFK